jgi:hypothetical protein
MEGMSDRTTAADSVDSKAIRKDRLRIYSTPIQNSQKDDDHFACDARFPDEEPGYAEAG